MLQYSRLRVLNNWLYSYTQKNQICKTLHGYMWSCIQGQIAKTYYLKLNLGPVPCSWLLHNVSSLHKTVDALWALNCRRQMRYHHYHFCQWTLPMGALWVMCILLPWNYPKYNIKNRWHYVDAPLTLCWCSVDAELTLCWRSVDAPLTLILGHSYNLVASNFT